MAVLQCFAGSQRDLGLVEIAGTVGLSPSTTHRLVRALCGAGMLAQDDRTDRYFLGPTAAVLGQLAQERLGYDLVLPLLQELAVATGESVNLGVRAGDEVIVVLHVSSSAPLRFDQGPGTHIPIHASAMGKAILAFGGDPAQVVETLGPLAKLTSHTVTARAKLRGQLEEIRRVGWAVNDEERNPGVRAVGAPVLVGGGAVAGAISVQGPTVRLTPGRVAEIGPLVAATADRVGARLPGVLRQR